MPEFEWMKMPSSKSSIILALTLLLTAGCNVKIDTAKVRAEMALQDPRDKENLDTALTDIDQGKYKEALFPLRKLAFGAKLDKKQNDVLRDTMQKVQAKVGSQK